ncbi:unnamed protein product [Mytilus edulis]|uniref:C-type lectin domain-containing protein n=1 Tax=Mytilus edulis TaxID=6550 RepID=A0A8S3Q2T9_MYTED|nr:unnamed protein product [Mytilus edulis]
MRVVNNEHEIAFLKGQTQQLEHKLENTKRTFSCEIEDGQCVRCKYSPLEIPGKHSNESGDGSECPLDWVRRVDFGACYFLVIHKKSWNDAQEQCRRHNGSLTDINSENEAVFLAEYSRNHTARSVWIGGKNDHGVYKWFTSDGKTKHMNYTRWTNTQTQYNTRNRSLCAQLYDDVEYKWLKWNCDEAENFICKTYI